MMRALGVPLYLTSSDGRVDVTAIAHGVVGFGDEGMSFLSIDAGGGASAADFAASTGVSGVDLGGFDYGSWSGGIYLPVPGGPAHGFLSVTGSRPGAFMTLEQLDWHNEQSREVRNG
jgi:hypothetical protein